MDIMLLSFLGYLSYFKRNYTVIMMAINSHYRISHPLSSLGLRCPFVSHRTTILFFVPIIWDEMTQVKDKI